MLCKQLAELIQKVMQSSIQSSKNSVEESQNQNLQEQDFFTDNNPPTKKEKKESKRRTVKPYNTTRVNISHNGFKTEDFHNRNFIFDAFLLLTKKFKSVFSRKKVCKKQLTRNNVYALGG